MSLAQVVTEDDIQTFINKFKAADTDKKVDQLQYIGLRFEHVDTLPESTFDALTSIAQPLIRSPHHLLLSSVLSNYLTFYIPLIPPSPVRHVQLAISQLLPGLLEKLNDPKERVHEPACDCVASLGQKAVEADAAAAEGGALANSRGKDSLTSIWENGVKDTLAGKGSRGKMQGMKVVLKLRQTVKGSLKPWLAPMVDLLEDGDSQVREAAREALVAMLSPADVPAAARTELKKLLTARKVRATIAETMLARILGGATPNPADIPLPADEAPIASNSKPTAASSAEDVSVVYIASARDLETEFGKMLPHFAGKETEHNWTPREKAVVRIRGMLRGEAHKQYPEAFLTGMKAGIFEGVSRTIVSLRTTVSQQSCALMQELAEQLGSSYDGFVEGFLPTLGKMAGYTKKIIAEKSQKVLTAILTHSTAQPRVFVGHILAGISDKNVQTRQYSAAHLKTFIDVQAARSKNAMDQAGLTEQIETALKKGLADVNPQARESARSAYWSFARIWPTRAQAIMDGLDGQAKKQLEKAQAAGTAAAASASNGGPSKPAVKRAPLSGAAAFMAERRRAQAEEAKREAAAAAQASRVVSNPVPPSPSVAQGSGFPRSASTQSFETPIRRGLGARAETTPNASPSARRSGLASGLNGSPVMGRSGHKSGAIPISSSASASASASSARSRSSSLARSISRSPPAPPIVPNRTPLRTTQSRASTVAQLSPTASTSTASVHTVQTPVLARKSLTGSMTAQERLYASAAGSPFGAGRSGSASGSRPHLARSNSGTSSVVDEALRAQADQALSAAEQLLDFDEPTSSTSSNGQVQLDSLVGNMSALDVHPRIPSADTVPVTPNRLGLAPRTPSQNGQGAGYDLLRTPVNGGNGSRAIWEDSPRNQAVTPKFLEKLKGRRYEQGWWARQQQPSPLRPTSPSPASAISADLAALASGTPEMRNLQKLALFSSEHDVPLANDERALETEGDELERTAAMRVWKDDRLFERVWEGLVTFLQPDRPKELLEQALVLLWEMVQHQWALFEDKEEELVDALFRLRASSSHTVLESTNSLLSLLTNATDCVLLLTTLRTGLESYLASTPVNASATASASLFALNGIGMCILRLPASVVEIESARLEGIIMSCLSSETVTTRQAANTVILAIQCVLGDDHRTLALFPGLSGAQRNLATYLMETNGLLRSQSSHSLGQGTADDEQEEVRRQTVLAEMEGQMAKGASAL